MSRPLSSPGPTAIARPLRRALAAFAIATGLVAALSIASVALPWLRENLGVAVAAVFVFVPYTFARREGRDLHDYGFSLLPDGRAAIALAAVLVAIYPLFVAGFLLFYELICSGGGWSVLALPGQCPRFNGWLNPTFGGLGWWIVEAFAVQLIVVAIPEEIFFRGYLHDLCERALGPGRRLWGGGVGWALVVSSVLFAIGHLAGGFDARRLAVFFPGLLFGWLRSATGTIFAGAVIHALSNLLIQVLSRIYF